MFPRRLHCRHRVLTAVCQTCGDVLTKKKLDGHRNQCHGASFTCLDCMVHFRGTEYRSHTVRYAWNFNAANHSIAHLLASPSSSSALINPVLSCQLLTSSSLVLQKTKNTKARYIERKRRKRRKESPSPLFRQDHTMHLFHAMLMWKTTQKAMFLQRYPPHLPQFLFNLSTQ